MITQIGPKKLGEEEKFKEFFFFVQFSEDNITKEKVFVFCTRGPTSRVIMDKNLLIDIDKGTRVFWYQQ